MGHAPELLKRLRNSLYVNMKNSTSYEWQLNRPDIPAFAPIVTSDSAMATEYCIRDATLTDLDAIVNVVLVAMPHSPQWDYRFIHKREYPNDHFKFTKLLFEQFILPENDDWHIVVVEAFEASKPDAGKIVAFSVWDVSYVNKARRGPGYEPQNPMAIVAKAGGATRRDVAPRRQAVFRSACGEVSQRVFQPWGNRQLHLQILGVHTDYWRQGLGSKLVQWGMARAARDDVALTLIAGAAGSPLYSKLDFKTLETFSYQVPGEEQKIVSDAMVYEPVAA